jgi:dienelactone hydrolase
MNMITLCIDLRLFTSWRSIMRLALFVLFFTPTAMAQSAAERMLQDYFSHQTKRVAERALAGIHSLEDWKVRRETYREQIQEMLGLSPFPPRTELKATVAGKAESEKFVVERISFQSLPGLYVTANLYLPKTLAAPAPAILYLCGHARVVKNGIAYGNKSNYQHHAAWFAEHGYVAFIIDTLDLGEIEGEHHGTFRRQWWWWPTRGYTPAGVETWNAIRALDYLATRPEVDMQRIGVTGRSGGGAYTWFLAAVDDRPSALVPVAGITDMTNHVVDGAIEGHCDCMYQVNTYGWDFSLLAALAAPRPLLLANSDKDRIFPLDGVLRIHRQLKSIYKLFNAEDKLGLLITEGPHRDTPDLQVPAFRWMNRWLKKEEALINHAAVPRFSPEAVKVFKTIPADQINTSVHESFVPAAPVPAVPGSTDEWSRTSADWLQLLRDKVFRNWPNLTTQPKTRVTSDRVRNQIRVRLVEFQPDEAYLLTAVLLTDAAQKPSRLSARVLDNSELQKWGAFGEQYFPELPIQPGLDGAGRKIETEIGDQLRTGNAIALVMPRGVGPTSWPPEKNVHIRRRFLLLGQSHDAMQVWDARMALAALGTLPELEKLSVSLMGSGSMSVVALFSGIFEDRVTALELENPPSTLARAGSFPNALRYFDLPQIMALALPRSLLIRSSMPSDWDWTVKISKLVGGKITFGG